VGEAYGLCTVFCRIWWRRLTDCLRIFTGFWGRRRKEEAYGFLPDVKEEATDFYRIWGWRLADCLWIFIGFGGGGLRIVYGFLPDSGRRLTDCLRIFSGFVGGRLRIVYGFLTGFGGGGLRIAYGFLPDVEDKAYELFTDFDRM